MEKVTKNSDGSFTVWHGEYGWRTKYEAVLHWYAGTGSESGPSGFAELLQILDPPVGKAGVLIHVRIVRVGSRWYEFDSVTAAMTIVHAAVQTFETPAGPIPAAVAAATGFIRAGTCSADHAPWFYDIR